MTMTGFRFVVAALTFIAAAISASAQEPPTPPTENEFAAPANTPAPKPVERITLPHLDIPSLDSKTTVITHLFRPKPKDGETADMPRPAIVMLHGCSGLLARNGRFFGIYRTWAAALLRQGYVVLVVDSATTRGFGQTCSPGEARQRMWRERPDDAYAALTYLQAQPYVAADRVALMGWSQGGGVVLLSINDKSIGRPAQLKTDFAAAVAFYPGACSDRSQSRPYTQVEPHGWTSHIPLLTLFGAADTWVLLGPCEDFLNAAKARGNPIELHSYPNALHGFDAPNTPVTMLPQYQEFAGARIPSVGTDKDARADAFARAPAFLQSHLAR